MGLYNIVIHDPDFYALAQEGTSLTIDKSTKTLHFPDHPGLSFPYSHSRIEDTLLEAGGVLSLYDCYGNGLFREMIKPVQEQQQQRLRDSDVGNSEAVAWNAFSGPERSVKAELEW